MPHPFDNLRSLAALDDAALLGRLDLTAVETLVACSELLENPPLTSASISAENFVREVRRVESDYRMGARVLGEAIIQSGALSDAGDRAAAQNVLAGFLASCRAPFYRRIAAARMTAISGHDDT